MGPAEATGDLGSLELLPYAIYQFSSYSGDFVPKHILVNKTSDQKSRWLSGGNKPPQYVILKLEKPAIVCKVLFGKYEKSHPCNIQKMKVYGGLDGEHMHLLLEGGLKNDNVPEILNLSSADGRPFPAQFIKIVPLQSWGGGFNFSIWHVQLWGTTEDDEVREAVASMTKFREREAIRLCLKHLRQYEYSEAFDALQKKSKVLLEDPILTQLHQELVTEGRFEAAEGTLRRAMEEGYFDDYTSRQLIRARWTNIPYPMTTNSAGGPLTPDMRGGHQMCIDPDSEQIFLYGGWNGSKELGDLWQFSITKNMWTCLSLDTSQQDGPGPKSCHTMCYNSRQGILYVLGGYVDESACSDHLSAPPCGFYMCSVATNCWQLLSSDTSEDGGPSLIYDHQMCYDHSSGVLYVLGGRIVSKDTCGGLYAYRTMDKQWLCLAPDYAGDNSVQPALPRSGHVTLFHPTLHQLFVLGGQRQQDILSDMVTYDVRSGETSILFDGKNRKIPVADITLRAALDLRNDQICVTGLSKPEEREIRGSNSLWLYHISLDQWSRVMRDEKVPMYDFPIPRYAHSFVYNPACDCYYMFGGNSGTMTQTSTNMMRLDDFWKMQLMRQSKENILRECQLLLRKQRYIELSWSSPVEAVVYLKTCVASVVDHDDHDESKQYRELTSALFSSGEPTSNSVSVSSPSTCVRTLRSDLYDSLTVCFPQGASQPIDNLIDFVKLKH